MTRDLKHAGVPIRLGLSVMAILVRLSGFISGPIADGLLMLALLVLIHYVALIVFHMAVKGLTTLR